MPTILCLLETETYIAGNVNFATIDNHFMLCGVHVSAFFIAEKTLILLLKIFSWKSVSPIFEVIAHHYLDSSYILFLQNYRVGPLKRFEVNAFQYSCLNLSLIVVQS